MKAVYQKPSVEEISMSLSSLIAASLPEKVEDGFNTTTAPTTEETSGNLSRDIWDDED